MDVWIPASRWLTDPAWIANHFAISDRKGTSCSSHVAGGKVERKSTTSGIAKPNGNISVTIAIDPESSVKLITSHGEFMGVMGDPQQ